METRTPSYLVLAYYQVVGVGRAGWWALKTDHWFYGLFQSAPYLIALLLPAAGAVGASAVPSLGPDSPGDVLYRYCFSSRRLRLRRSLAAMSA